MSPLGIYQTIVSNSDRRRVREAALRATYPNERRLRAWGNSDCATASDHPALVDALREHWWPNASIDAVTYVLGVSGPPRTRELAVLLCATAVSHLEGDLAAELVRIRLAWVRGEISEEKRFDDIFRVRSSWVASGKAVAVATAYSPDGASNLAAGYVDPRDPRRAPVRGALAVPLRILFPDPCRLDHVDALRRWDEAVNAARSIPEFVLAKPRAAA